MMNSQSLALDVTALSAGYGRFDVVHDIALKVGAGRSRRAAWTQRRRQDDCAQVDHGPGQSTPRFDPGGWRRCFGLSSASRGARLRGDCARGAAPFSRPDRRGQSLAWRAASAPRPRTPPGFVEIRLRPVPGPLRVPSTALVLPQRRRAADGCDRAHVDERSEGDAARRAVGGAVPGRCRRHGGCAAQTASGAARRSCWSNSASTSRCAFATAFT